MIVNEVEVVTPKQGLPKLPVARTLWRPKPNLKIAAAAWIYAGGAHHTGFSQALTTEHLRDFAEIAGIEFVVIDAGTQIPNSGENSAGITLPTSCRSSFFRSLSSLRTGRADLAFSRKRTGPVIGWTEEPFSNC